MIRNQIGTFFSSKLIANIDRYHHVHQLSLLDCKNSEMGMINWYLKIFPSLHSLCITQSVLDTQYPMTYVTHGLLCEIVFGMTFTELADITLTTNDGIVLSKQLSPNTILKRLTIALRTIDDLLVLLGGLLPNLIELQATLYTNRAARQILVPLGSSSLSMSHLTKFRLTTDEDFDMQLEYLLNVIKPLTQLVTFKLDVKRWISSNNIFPEGNQIESIVDEFMPRLQYFYCSIRTTCVVHMTVKLMGSVG
jgi:hypothetical protein